MINFVVKDSRKSEHVMHPSTKSAMTLLQRLKEGQGGEEGATIANALDIGCGSGILALFVAELWPESTVVAGDISKLAIAEIQENVAQNGLQERVKGILAEGLDHKTIGAHAPYSLIIANLLAQWHMKYLREINAMLAPNGKVILAGIRPWQMQELEAAIPYAKLAITEQAEADGWTTLVLS